MKGERGKLRQIVAVVFEAGGFLAPVFVDLDEEFEEYLLAEESLKVLARIGADAFEGNAGAADEDTFL